MSLKQLTLAFLFLTGTVILSTSLSFADPEHRGEKPPTELEGEIPAKELEGGHDHPHEPLQPHDRHLLAEDLEGFRKPPFHFPPKPPFHFPPHRPRFPPHKPPPHFPPHKPPPHFPPHKPPPHFPPHKPPHKPPTAN